MKLTMRMIMVMVAILAMFVSITMASTETDDKNFTGDINFDGTMAIRSTKVSVTAAQINAAGGGTTATITPSSITNLTGTIVMSNAVFGGTISGTHSSGNYTNLTGTVAASNGVFTYVSGQHTSGNITGGNYTNLTGSVAASNSILGGTLTVAGAVAANTNASIKGLLTYSLTKGAGAVDVAGAMSNAPAGALTNVIWFVMKDAASTNWYAVPGVQVTAP